MNPQTITVNCILCGDDICAVDAKLWPPLFNGKRVFSNKRLWDESLFHTIYDHHSGQIVAVHHECKITYYQSTRNGGRQKTAFNEPRFCPNCQTTCPIKEFYLEDNKLCHAECDAGLCLWCHEPFGRSKKTTLATGYDIHESCRPIICLKTNQHMHQRHHRWKIDVDRFWPDLLTRQTCRDFPPEFLVTIRTFLLVIRRLHSKHLVPTDIVLLIMNFAIAPMSYPYQHGFDLLVCPTVKGGPCVKCDKPTALTRFDQGYCQAHDCLDFTDKKCHHGHFIAKVPLERLDCTAYRCQIDSKCSKCRGAIRHDYETPSHWCRRDECNYVERHECHCGRLMYKTVGLNGRNITLTAEQCSQGKCRYYLMNRLCYCGEALYTSSRVWFSCTVEKCNSNKRVVQMQDSDLIVKRFTE